MTETKEERRKRILAERAARREQFEKQKDNPTYRRWIIFKQQAGVKYYEITQNLKNLYSRYTSREFWNRQKLVLEWTIQEYKKLFKELKKEITVNVPNQIKEWYVERKYNFQVYLNTKIGNPELEYEQKINTLISKELLHYNQTLNNEEWLGAHVYLIRQEVDNITAAKRVIQSASFAPLERNKTLYDLLVAVHKERRYRKQRELDKYTWGSTEFEITEKEMRTLENNVDKNLKEWEKFLEGFKK